jgi:ribosomal protein S18 acetylase RimI-like enzyme
LAATNGSDVVIRRARVGDWGRVYRTVRASFRGELVDPLDVLVMLLLPWVRVLVAEDGGELVGTTIVIPAPLSRSALISTVGVIPAYRRQGVARALMAAAERAADGRRLRLDVYADNAAALALYRSLGYRERQRSRGRPGGRERVEMEK